MKTDELIALLAHDVAPVERHVAGRRYAGALGLGALASTVLMLATLGIRPDLAAAAHLPMFWVKLGFAGALAAASLLAVLRLSRPGARLDGVPIVLAAPVLLIWALAVFELWQADPGQRLALVLGTTWKVCPVLIAMLAVPVFAGSLWAMRGLAPARLGLAGAAAGLLAGSVAALVYCLHCPELEAPFIGIWYLLGMLIPALAGGLSARALLRW